MTKFFTIILLFISIWGEQESRVIDYYLRFCCRLILISWGIKMVFRNMYSGTTEYTPLLKNFYLTNDGSSTNKKGFIPIFSAYLIRSTLLFDFIID